MRSDAVWGLLLSVLAAGLLVLAYQPREITIFSQADNMSWPRRLLWPLLGFSLLLAANSFAAARRRPPDDGSRMGHRSFAKPLALALGFGTALALVDVVGFLPVTFAISALIPMALGRRGAGVIVFAFVMTLVVWGAFMKGLAVPLPRGTGIFRELSLLVH